MRRRTLPHDPLARTGRALVGVSAGGYGAMHLALQHLDQFSVVESWSGYFHPTDPTGTKPLDLGSAAANAHADVHRQLQSNRARLKSLPTYIAFYVGSDDSRFLAENRQLNRELSQAGIPHVFRVYPGGHDQALWQRYAAPWLTLALDHLAPAPANAYDLDRGHDRQADDPRPARLPRDRRAARRRGARDPRHRARSSCASASSRTSASGSSRGSCRASSCRRSASSASSACISRATGFPGASAVAYGLTCMELEAGDSGIRSLVSVQGSLAMFAIWRWGSEEQKERWLPPMHAGDAIGCFGLTEPDAGSDPASMRTHAKRDGSDWILNGSKMWITNGTIADVAVVWARTEDGKINGFLVEKGMPGFEAPEMKHKLSLRASITSELVLTDVRVPEENRFPEVDTLRGPLSCLNEARYGIVWGAVGAARACFESALDYAKERMVFGKPIAGYQLTQQKLAEMALEINRGDARRAAPRPHEGRRHAAARAREHGQDGQRARRARGVPHARARFSAATGSRSSTR